MADVQLEHGYTRAADQLLEALSATPLPASHLRVFLAHIRMLYGYRRKRGRVSLGKVAGMTGLPERSVRRVRQDLARWGLLEIETPGPGRTPTVTVVKDYDLWGVAPTVRPEDRPSTPVSSDLGSEAGTDDDGEDTGDRGAAEEPRSPVTPPPTDEPRSAVTGVSGDPGHGCPGLPRSAVSGVPVTGDPPATRERSLPGGERQGRQTASIGSARTERSAPRTAAPEELSPGDHEKVRAWVADVWPAALEDLDARIEEALDYYRRTGERCRDWAAAVRGNLRTNENRRRERAGESPLRSRKEARRLQRLLDQKRAEAAQEESLFGSK